MNMTFGFRPLSGIMVSNCRGMTMTHLSALFPSPLGDYGF
jgi:hypothetical protein